MPPGVNVALGFQRYVNQAVTGHLADHVVEEAVAGVYFVPSQPIEVNGHGDAGLPGLSVKGR
jgi:hypothetical protein